ncbi:MAG: peptidase E [Patescibacteria group bacterium]
MPIITIGGGSMSKDETLAIDKEIVRLAKKAKPSLLFIPTASDDDLKYWASVDEHFKKLGCKTDVLFLIRENPNHKEIALKISAADIIYIGGGNTLKMMKLWRKLGVDKILKTAWKNEKILCGISAGSICWYESGHSDSMSFYSPKKWDYIKVRGLGFLKGIHCPHYNGRTLRIARRTSFKKMIAKTGGIGFAVDNGCALVYEGEKMRVIGESAYKVFRKNGRVLEEKIHEA